MCVCVCRCPVKALPVKALALPELTNIAAPCDISPPILDWQSSTQAALVAERVKTPATVEPAAIEASMTSVRPAYFIPAAAVAKVTPEMMGNLGNEAGAKGDIFIISPSNPRLKEQRDQLYHLTLRRPHWLSVHADGPLRRRFGSQLLARREHLQREVALLHDGRSRK